MNKNNLVIKSNKLNQARYHLTIQEQRLILAMISEIEPGDDIFKSYRLAVKDFMKITGITGKGSYGHLKAVTKNLLSKVLVIDEPTGELQTHWVDYVKYYDSEGYLELSFSSKLRPYLLVLKKEFTRYQLKNIIRLKSGYSVRIYELLKQYQGIGTRYFPLDELRSILSIPDTKLKRYTDLRRYVLEVAKKELINSDISFSYEPKKHVRKVIGIHFNIFRNEDQIKKSYKPRKKSTTGKNPANKVIKETQLILELESKKEKEEAQKDQLIKKNHLEDLWKGYPQLYKKLEKKAIKQLKKAGKYKIKSPGINLTVKLKMQELLPSFSKQFNIVWND